VVVEVGGEPPAISRSMVSSTIFSICGRSIWVRRLVKVTAALRRVRVRSGGSYPMNEVSVRKTSGRGK
jgi:hypothetical protein